MIGQTRTLRDRVSELDGKRVKVNGTGKTFIAHKTDELDILGYTEDGEWKTIHVDYVTYAK